MNLPFNQTSLPQPHPIGFLIPGASSNIFCEEDFCRVVAAAVVLAVLKVAKNLLMSQNMKVLSDEIECDDILYCNRVRQALDNQAGSLRVQLNTFATIIII